MKKICVSICVLLCLSVAASPAFAQSFDLPNESSETEVLIYSFQGTNFFVDAPTKIYDKNKDVFILIHGAQSSIVLCPYLVSTAQAILQTQPNATVLAIDWSPLAHAEGVKSLDEFRSISPEAQIYLQRFFPTELEQETFVRLYGSLVPIQAAANVKTASSQIYRNLFVSQRLNPKNTKIIGHSLGAYIAYDIAKKIANDGAAKLNSLILLEPAPQFLFVDNSRIELNANLAEKENVVYKTSTIMSTEIEDTNTIAVDLMKDGPILLRLTPRVLREYYQHQMVWEVCDVYEFGAKKKLDELSVFQTLGFVF